MIPIILSSGGIGAIIAWFAITVASARHPVRRRKLPSLTKYMIFSIGFVVVYTIMEFVVSTITGTTHDVLTGCVYGFFGGEVVTCGLIKIFKLKEEKDESGNNTQSAGYYSSPHDIDSAGDQEDPR